MSIAPSAIERLQDIAGGTGALGRQRHPHHRGRARRKQSGRPPQRVPLWQFRSPSPTSGRQLTWGCVCRVQGRSLSGVLELRMPKPDARRQLLDVFRLNAPEASPTGALAAASDRPASRCRALSPTCRRRRLCYRHMADDSMRSTVHQPKRGEHDHDYVNKTDDRGPHQVNVAGLKVVEEPANRDQHRPQNEHIVHARVGDAINQSEREQEHHLSGCNRRDTRHTSTQPQRRLG